MLASEIKSLFRSGKLSKPDYIAQMFDAHTALFKYAEFIGETDIQKIEVLEGEIRITSRRDGIQLICDPQDHRSAAVEILNFNEYEPIETKILLHFASSAKTILDIGANIGWFSILFSKRNPKAVIHAFEPIPTTFKKFSRHLDINKAENITAHQMGLGAKNGLLEFYFNPHYSSCASAANLLESPDAETIRSPIIRLDDFVRDNRIVPDLIKCDVEGAELHVFQGGMQTIAQAKPAIITEMLRKWSSKFGYHPNDIIRLLGEANYSCYKIGTNAIEPMASMTDETIETNFLFLHAEKHSEEIKNLSLRS